MDRSNTAEGRQHCLPHIAAKPLGGGWGRRFRLPADSFTPSEALPIQRSKTKLKYLAAVESGSGTFLNDTRAEEMAEQLRRAGD